MKNIFSFLIIVIIIALGYSLWSDSNNAPTTETTTGVNPPNSAEGAPEGSIHNLPVPEGVRAAKTALATQLNIDSSKILILKVEETNWTDSCLGLGGPAESCLAAITPGYSVLMQANGAEYRYRTDMTGAAVRAENV